MVRGPETQTRAFEYNFSPSRAHLPGTAIHGTESRYYRIMPSQAPFLGMQPDFKTPEHFPAGFGKRMIEGNHAIRRVTTADAAKADELLNSEIEGIIPTALKLNHGIRVIRLGPGNYVVETAPEVTCGYTVYEQ